jgi:hypothetical protein
MACVSSKNKNEKAFAPVKKAPAATLKVAIKARCNALLHAVIRRR